MWYITADTTETHNITMSVLKTVCQFTGKSGRKWTDFWAYIIHNKPIGIFKL